MASSAISVVAAVLIVVLLHLLPACNASVLREEPVCGNGSLLVDGDCDNSSKACGSQVFLVQYPMQGCDCHLTDEELPEIRQDKRTVRRVKSEEESEEQSDSASEEEQSIPMRRLSLKSLKKQQIPAKEETETGSDESDEDETQDEKMSPMHRIDAMRRDKKPRKKPKKEKGKKKQKDKWSNNGRLYHRCSCPVSEECA